MASSFNSFGSIRKDYGNPSVPIWLGKVRPVPVGGSLDASNIVAGALYPAGSPIQLDGKVIKVLVAFEVVSFASGDVNDTIVIKPHIAGQAKILPVAGNCIQKIGATFDAKGKAASVVSVAVGTEGNFDVLVAHGTTDALAKGDYITLSASSVAGSNKSIAVIPTHYLYNDIYLGDIDVENEMAGASGSAVAFHADGILINRTPSAPFAAQMKVAVPGVLQVNY